MFATYVYGVADFRENRTVSGRPYIARHQMRVKVLALNYPRSRVKFMEYHVDGRGPGTIATVKTSNLRLDRGKVPPIEMRLPCKDE